MGLLGVRFVPVPVHGYLAVSGGFDLPKVMDSFSTNTSVKIGGFQGRFLKTEDLFKTLDTPC